MPEAEVSSDPHEFREAVEWFARRVPLTKDQWEALTLEARRKAFTVASVMQAELLEGVQASLTRALQEGTNFRDWKKQVEPALNEAWGGPKPWRVETIFRTNLQSAYGAGRYQQLTDPDVLEARPYWMYDAIVDGRTTDLCEKLHGTVLPATDPWWDGRLPPLHFNCRSSIRSLSEEEAREQPKFAGPEPAFRDKPDTRGAGSFGWKPDQSEWEPDTQKYSEQIRKELKMRLALGVGQLRLPLREPPVAIGGPQAGPGALRGAQWQAGAVRSDLLDPDAPRKVGQSPWFLDEEFREAGTLDARGRGVKKPQPHEAEIDEYLVAQGNQVARRKEGSQRQKEKHSDRTINGVEVELRSVLVNESTLQAQKALSRAIERKAKERQARYLIVDVRATSLTLPEAQKALDMRDTSRFSREFVSLRIIGKSFDITVYPG